MELRSTYKKLFFPLLAAIALAGCYNDKADQLYPEPTTGGAGGGSTCDTANVSYATTIKPIITQYCAIAGCHNTSVNAAGYDFTKYSEVKRSAVPNNRLLGVINHQSGFSPMPKGMSKLAACDINKITAWVNQGALDN